MRVMAAVVVRTARLRMGSAPALDGRMRFPARLAHVRLAPQVLTRLLPAGAGSVSTKQAVSELAKAVPPQRFLMLALWGWLLASIVIGLLAWGFGAPRANAAGAAAL